MRILKTFATLTLSLTLLAQQDAPLRPPGTFTGQLGGSLKAPIHGDASARVTPAKREFHLLLSSERMMEIDHMIAVTIALPERGGTYTITAKQAQVQWQNLTTRARHVRPATGSFTFEGTSSLSGRFQLEARDGSAIITLSGTFEEAPLIHSKN